MSEVRIDQLSGTTIPTDQHEIPSMKGGLTVKLTIRQIINLTKDEILNQVGDDLDTLSELASAIGNDPNFSTTVASQIAALDAVPDALIAFFPFNSAPSGWIKANGALLNRTTYSNLFSLIGTTFGFGDGSTTFQIPDLRGEFVRVFDDGKGVDSGRVFGSNQSQEIQSHRHDQGHSGSGSQLNQVSGNGGSHGYTLSSATPTGYTGGNETRPRNIALTACIKI